MHMIRTPLTESVLISKVESSEHKHGTMYIHTCIYAIWVWKGDVPSFLGVVISEQNGFYLSGPADCPASK